MSSCKPIMATLLASCVALAIGNQAFSAEVPAGVKLAKEQIMVRNNRTEPQTLDPQKIQGVPGSNIAFDLFEGLVVPGPSGEALPGVAKSWETKDNKTFIFHLRHDAKWSNGDPVTANDFVYAWRRLVDIKTASPYAYYLGLASVKNSKAISLGKMKPATLGVKAINKFTLEVQLERSVPYFVGMLINASLAPTPQKVIEKWGDKWTRPKNIVTNGAFKLKKWVVNEKIELVRNPNYWNNKKTVIDTVRFLAIADANAALQRYQTGEITMTDEIPTEQFKKMQREHSNEVKIVGKVGTYFYAFNNKKKPFDDVRVRKALSYAIDRDKITKYIMGQGEKPAYTFTPEITLTQNPKNPNETFKVDVAWASWTQAVRIAEAKELLKEAGFDKDHPLSVSILYNTNEAHKKVAIAIASMWKKNLGVKATLENQEWKTFLDSRQQGHYQVAREGWIGDYLEPSTMLAQLQSGIGTNDTGYASVKYDKTMKSAASAVTFENRINNYKHAETILAQEMPVAPIYQYVSARMVKPYVGGYPQNPLDNIPDKDLYIIAH